MQIDVVPISARLCDLCNGTVTSEDFVVVKSFVLTDWGVICIECWDSKISHHEEFEIIKLYAKSQTIEDEWVKCPLVFASFAPDEHPREGDG